MNNKELNEEIARWLAKGIKVEDLVMLHIDKSGKRHEYQIHKNYRELANGKKIYY